VNDNQRIENASAAREARAGAGRPQPRGARASDIDAALIRYLAVEQYHEKVEEDRAADETEQGTSR
jgi:hypothetical protein